MRRFKRVVEKESYANSGDGLDDDVLMVLTAIPFVGTGLILLYFCIRTKKEYWIDEEESI